MKSLLKQYLIFMQQRHCKPFDEQACMQRVCKVFAHKGTRGKMVENKVNFSKKDLPGHFCVKIT